jgi:hypothetical protein
MRNQIRPTISLVAVAAALLLLTPSVGAQAREGVLGELLKDIADLEKKVITLAKAMPEAAFGWRPGPGVRSTGEVLQHVAADNYLLPILAGHEAPKETGITKDYKTALAFEKKSMSRDAIIAEVEKSFAFLRSSMTSTTDAQLESTIDMFGQKSTVRRLWITTATHLHEHLGQLIAYGRSNKVVPPWSK